jgi:hypothetical protein
MVLKVLRVMLKVRPLALRALRAQRAQRVRLMRQVYPLNWEPHLSLVLWAYRVLLARHYRS